VNHRSLAFRLSVWYALILSATFTLVGTGIFYGLEQYLRSNLSDSLRRRSAQVEQILAQAPIGVTDAEIAQSINTRVAPDFNNRFVRVTRAPAAVIYRSGQPADRSFDSKAVPLLTGAWPLKNISRRAVTIQNQRLLVSTTPLDATSGHYLIELGTSLESIEALQERLLALLGLLLPVLVICAAGGGYLLVNWALRPVDRMSQTAAQMSMHNLEARLPVLSTGDALQRLSVSLNQMLTRLRDSVQISRRFLADASHELRTPLTVIKGELQQMVGTEAVEAGLRERIGSVLEEVARLEHLVSGLLVISRLDAGEVRRKWGDVDLAELASGTAEQMRLMAEDRGIHFECSALRPTVVHADRARLKQVIVNLLDNAIRFTPRGGTVTMRTRQNDAYDILEVLDTGIGIPAAALAHVFDRFYRVDEARSRDDGGAGLGLSIAKSICTAHGAQIEANSEPGQGSCFRLMFPRLQRAVGRRAARDNPGEPARGREWRGYWPTATRITGTQIAARNSASDNEAKSFPKPTALL
jgi:heavy metal sensor kinase